MRNQVLVLICRFCTQEMPRVRAYGLKIGDGFVAVQDGYVQVCSGCGHEYHPGETLRYQIGIGQEV